MEVYLVQHAEATSKEQNPDRPITEKGRLDITNVATVATKLDLKVQQIRHSGKTRTGQTAKVLAEALSPPDGVVRMDGLGPLDDVEPIAVELAHSSQPLMLVGHLPFMERLTGMMLTGDDEQSAVKFTNAGIVCLSRERRWQVTWILTPDLARNLTGNDAYEVVEVDNNIVV